MRKAAFLIVGFLIAGIAVYFWSGAYNVAAVEPHWGVFSFFLEEIRDRSIITHSRGIKPPSIEDQKLVETGFPHFHEMCRLCHGAPGYPLTEFAQGLYPAPPSLASQSTQQKWNNAQLFWIVQNGIKMTGMPAFGPTHEEDELWGVVAFLRRLPEMNEEDYDLWVRKTGPHDEHEHMDKHDEHEHTHEHGREF